MEGRGPQRRAGATEEGRGHRGGQGPQGPERGAGAKEAGQGHEHSLKDIIPSTAWPICACVLACMMCLCVCTLVCVKAAGFLLMPVCRE